MKRYVAEPESAAVARWLGERAPVTCRLAETEIASAIGRRFREGGLGAEARTRALDALRADLPRIHVVEITPPVVAAVHDLFRRYPLRAADALHLASALLLRSSADASVDFVAFDARLAEAARAEGLAVLP